MKITLLEKAPGVWRLRIETVANGARAFSYRTVRGDRVAAEVARAGILKDAEAGAWAAGDKITLGAYLTQYVNVKLASKRIGEVTAGNYRTWIAAHVAPRLGGVRLQRVTGRDLEKFYMELSAIVSATSMATLHSGLIRPAFKAARKAKLIPSDPSDEITAPRRTASEPKALDDAGVARLLAAIAGTRLDAPVRFLLATGLRRGELLGLEWPDVALDDGRIHVRRELVRVCNPGEPTRHVVKAPKTKAGVRTVYLSAEAVEILRAQPRDVDRVFPGMSPGAFTAAVQRLCVKAGVATWDGRTFSPHVGRHTHITNLLRRVGKAGARAVSKRAGHANVAVTLGVYQTVLDDDERNLAEIC